jgi:hypothetical protein
MNSMKLLQKFGLTICGKYIADVAIKDEWSGFITLTNTQGWELVVRRKKWNNGKEWAKESNSFIEQELDILSADSRYGIPETEVVFAPPPKGSESND